MRLFEYTPRQYPYDFGFWWVQSLLREKGMAEKKTIIERGRNGGIAPGRTIEELVKRMQEINYDLFYEDRPARNTKEHEFIFVHWLGEAAFFVSYTESEGAIINNICALNDVEFQSLDKVSKEFIGKKITKSKAFVLAQGEDGPYLHEVGTAGEKMVRENYAPEAMKQLDHAIEDFRKPSSEACGQVLILDGPPGTGKTRLCRGIIEALPKALIILVQSNMMSQLGSPQFIPVLQRASRPGQPIVLLIEDADECLSKRAADNMSEISAVLNFGDGILGAMIDIRIIATTNLPLRDLDPAVLREGRLCRRIEIGFLSPEQAEQIYRREGGTEEGLFTKEKFYTLAKCYAWARNSEEAVQVKSAVAKRIGFMPTRDDEADEPANNNYGLGLHPGDTVTLDSGEVAEVRDDGELVMVKTKGDLNRILGLDDDDDLVDEDP